MPLFLAEVEEQQRILLAVADETLILDRAIGDAKREISLLREYRTRLIADLVTGWLDVREVAARHPDDAAAAGLSRETRSDAACA